IFKADIPSGKIMSYTLFDIFQNQASLNKAPTTDLLLFNIESSNKGASTVFPVISLKQEDKKKIPRINGSAIIKDDKLAGFLNGEETKDLLFIKNQVSGGILVEEMQTENEPVSVSLEIFKNKTKVTPEVKNKEITFNVNIDTLVAVGEVNGKGNFFDEKGIKKLEEGAGKTLKKRAEALIKKLQQDYGADIFGFSSSLRENKVQAYKSVSNNWSETFKDLKVNVKAKISIKNSGILSKNIIEGE
ncbi:MAG: spore gernimation protein GerC, partial [Clostridia bacterium]|nr:spore gernimation protein GerC [Clostridia bacterium]